MPDRSRNSGNCSNRRSPLKLKKNIGRYNAWEEAVRAFQNGDDALFFEGMREGRFDPDTPAQGMDVAQAARNEAADRKEEKYIQSLMSPLPITSALYHGCMEKGRILPAADVSAPIKALWY